MSTPQALSQRWETQQGRQALKAIVRAIHRVGDWGEVCAQELGSKTVPNGRDLRGADLARLDLMGANLRDASLGGAYLRDAQLLGADLSGADLTGANITAANFVQAQLEEANLSLCNGYRASFTSAVLTGVILEGAVMTGADLQRAEMRGARLVRTNLEDANLAGADLTEALMTECKLGRAKLPGSRLIRVDLTDAVMAQSDLTGANLVGSDLTNADLRNANFSRAWLVDVQMTGARVCGLRSWECTLDGIKADWLDIHPDVQGLRRETLTRFLEARRAVRLQAAGSVPVCSFQRLAERSVSLCPKGTVEPWICYFESTGTGTEVEIRCLSDESLYALLVLLAQHLGDEAEGWRSKMGNALSAAEGAPSRVDLPQPSSELTAADDDGGQAGIGVLELRSLLVVNASGGVVPLVGSQVGGRDER